jgi:predicted AAA+ superfamily ATPase
MLKKEAKAYLFDWVEVADKAKRFENMVALHLYKAVSLWRASGQGDIDLRYIRDREKREVDFVFLENNRPVCLIECKYSDEQAADNLKYFQGKFKIPLAVQLVHKSGFSRKIKFDSGEILIISADRWLEMLP